MKGPKPLVSVYRNSDKTWSYQCQRCGKGRWTDNWKHTLEDGTEHADEHNNFGLRMIR